MGSETMSMKEVCRYLNLSEKEVLRRIHSEGLPAFKLGGVWRFRKIEVDDWLQRSMGRLSSERLSELEHGVSFTGRKDKLVPLVGPLVREDAISTSLQARSGTSVLKELVELAEKTGLVYDPDALLKALRERESLCPTSLEGGAAIPHPRKRQEWMLAESFMVIGIHSRGIPFGAPDGSITDIFFMPLCLTDSEHLQVLARICRMLQDGNLLSALRSARTREEIKELVVTREKELLKSWNK